MRALFGKGIGSIGVLLILTALFARDAWAATAAEMFVGGSPIPEAYAALANALDSVDPVNDPFLRRAMAAVVATRSSEHLDKLIGLGLRSDLPLEMQTLVWQLIREWAKPVSRDPVHGLWRPLAEQPVEVLAATLRQALPKIHEAEANSALGLIVAAEVGVDEARATLAPIVASEHQPPELRRRAVAALATAEDDTVAAALESAMNSSAPELRSAALQLMVERFPDRAVEQLVEASETASTAERQAAIAMLATTKVDAARAALATWVDRLERGECPPELQLDVLEAAVQSGDPGLVARHKTFLDRGGVDSLVAFSWSLAGGNAEAGRRIFTEDAALACRRCHSTTPGEALVGPNLSDVGARLSRADILEAIIRPNAKIAAGFQTTVLQLDTGQVVAGILRREDKHQVTLVDPDGKEITVDASTIEGRLEGLSAMPEDLIKQLTPGSVRDLVEFLSQQRASNPADAPAQPGHCDSN